MTYVTETFHASILHPTLACSSDLSATFSYLSIGKMQEILTKCTTCVYNSKEHQTLHNAKIPPLFRGVILIKTVIQLSDFHIKASPKMPEHNSTVLAGYTWPSLSLSKPMGVSEYRVTSVLPAELEKELSSVEDLQTRIQG